MVNLGPQQTYCLIVSHLKVFFRYSLEAVRACIEVAESVDCGRTGGGGGCSCTQI